MKFYDQVTITIQSGKGGDGSAAGRREAKIPRGGPAGGDGGKGGSVIFRACKDERTLMPFRYKKMFTAKPGHPGMSKDKYGADAQDIELLVPIGTLIKDQVSGDILAHLHTDNQLWTGARGGKGGMGNIHFKNAQNQFPTMALYGEPGEKRELLLELQLLADVALIGTPSVGKSTLINAVSEVKAKTAAYHFTTLVPNIGVVEHKGSSFTMIDVPGLVEGAGSGKGLGNEFLRHILKARIFGIFLDASKDIPGLQEPSLLLEEIMAYVKQRLSGSHERGQTLDLIEQELFIEDGILRYRASSLVEGSRIVLLQKAIYFIINKADALPDHELRDEYLTNFQEQISAYFHTYGITQRVDISHHSVFISALTREGIESMLDRLIALLQQKSYRTIGDQEIITGQDSAVTTTLQETTSQDLPFLLEKGYLDEKKAKNTRIWEVVDPEVCFLTFTLPWGNEEAHLWYREKLADGGHLKQFIKAGAKKGDILKVVSLYPGQPDKFVSRE